MNTPQRLQEGSHNVQLTNASVLKAVGIGDAPIFYQDLNLGAEIMQTPN
jgi:hypothetical protein